MESQKKIHPKVTNLEVECLYMLSIELIFRIIEHQKV